MSNCRNCGLPVNEDRSWLLVGNDYVHKDCMTNTDLLRRHVASYNSISAHRQNCLDVCNEVEKLTKALKDRNKISRRSSPCMFQCQYSAQYKRERRLSDGVLIIRRAVNRGLKLAESIDTKFIDIFNHLKAELDALGGEQQAVTPPVKHGSYVAEREAQAKLPGYCDICSLPEIEHRGGYDRHVFIDTTLDRSTANKGIKS